MTITIFITLIIIVLISGLYAISPYENNEKADREKTVVEQLGFENTLKTKKRIYSKLISFAVFALSLASLMAVYFFKI